MPELPEKITGKLFEKMNWMAMAQNRLW